MQRSLRFAALVCLLTLTSWLSLRSDARADMPYCGDIQGTVCTMPGFYITCYNTYNDYSVCTCNGPTSSWWCA
jgi:hypothetical protein